jgi:type I restriction enzyme M protein
LSVGIYTTSIKMAVKKSELYSSLWASCDELRGSMDASQYKDYVLVLLFMKYVSDKKDPIVELKEGTTFYDMLKWRGKDDIGNQINIIIGEFAKNNDLTNIITTADFNDETKLGTGKDKVDTLTNLLNIFNKPELDFSGNRADDDDLLGDAYEYLMQNFAKDSGKSKGQFYTPAEVSRVMAQLIEIYNSESQEDTLYDMTCGSGSLLLRAAELAPSGISIYGQENDNATRGLAVMNMWLHGFSDAEIKLGNTLANPQILKEDTGELQQFNYCIANPPFSYKKWMNGLNPSEDIFKRFDGYSIPPAKNGDYAFLLHMLKSLKSKGKGCIVMPLGVLFRGNTEAEIRKKIIDKGYIKAIVGLPANLFYGTGIAACLIVLDKEDADKRTHIFMIDASRGFIKDGNKNRLRERDIHKIVDTYKNKIEKEGYSRNIPITEISDPKNDYNLNIPRYINNQDADDMQDIEAHLLGGIPKSDIDALSQYWSVCPNLKNALFKTIKDRPKHLNLKVGKEDIINTIHKHPEFINFINSMSQVYTAWEKETAKYCLELKQEIRPKKEIKMLADNILFHFHKQPLTDKYAVYQHLLDYWSETMQDDFYEISSSGWKAESEVIRLQKKNQKGELKDIVGLEGLEGRLIPSALIVQEYFAEEQAVIDELNQQIETAKAKQEELIEENSSEDGLLAEIADNNGKVSKANVKRRLKEITPKNGTKIDADLKDEFNLLETLTWLYEEEDDKAKTLKAEKTNLEIKVIKKYPQLSEDEIKQIVIEKKWLAEIKKRVQTETDAVSHQLTERVKELAERYDTTLSQLTDEVDLLTAKVKEHLKQMNYT